MRKLFIGSLILLVEIGFGQTVYHVPFASKNNTFDISFRNSSKMEISFVTIKVVESPLWLHFKAKEINVLHVKSNSINNISFEFDITESAIVEKQERVQFIISSSSGEQITKEYYIQVQSPYIFELRQNFPNPFNPVTTISYQIPENGFASLKVYDILGKEVETLVDEMKDAGSYQVTFDATKMSSGVYFYRLQSGNNVSNKKMIVMK